MSDDNHRGSQAPGFSLRTSRLVRWQPSPEHGIRGHPMCPAQPPDCQAAVLPDPWGRLIRR